MRSSWVLPYLQVNLIIFVGWAVLFFISNRSLRLSSNILQADQLLKTAYLICVLFLLAPGLIHLLPKTQVLFPVLEIGSRGILGDFSLLGQYPSNTLFFSLSQLPNHKALFFLENKVEILIISLVVMVMAVFAIRFSVHLFSVRKVIQAAVRIRKIGNVVIVVSDQVKVPFSFYFPNRAYVVLPDGLVSNCEQMRLAVFHELQHHRQGDTQWIYLLQLLKCLFVFNPAIHFFERKVSEIQEFACDEALLRIKGVSPHAYGRCLVQVAENALKPGSFLVGTTSLGARTSGYTLKRRIEMILNYSSKGQRRVSTKVVGILVLVTLMTTAWASQDLIQERKITQNDAQTMANRIKKGSGHLPIVVNDSVVEQLNRYVGSPENRAKVRESLKRMKIYEPMILEALQSSQLPPELLAVPFAESGFDNSKREKGSIGRGIWMFIAETARRYKLRVDDKVDERLDPQKETGAAVNLLTDDYELFNDWGLAILAYNAGEKKVHEGIQKTGSKDVWKLIQNGYQGDKNYIPMVMAAALIIQNPQIAD